MNVASKIWKSPNQVEVNFRIWGICCVAYCCKTQIRECAVSLLTDCRICTCVIRKLIQPFTITLFFKTITTIESDVGEETWWSQKKRCEFSKSAIQQCGRAHGLIYCLVNVWCVCVSGLYVCVLDFVWMSKWTCVCVCRLQMRIGLCVCEVDVLTGCDLVPAGVN